jgi:hypothetical protein
MSQKHHDWLDVFYIIFLKNILINCFLKVGAKLVKAHGPKKFVIGQMILHKIF